MLNKFVINIRARDNWEDKPPYLILNKDLFLAILIGLLYITSEYTIKIYSPESIKDVLVQASHIFIIFLYPAFLLFKSLTKSLLLCILVFTIVIPLYYFIEKEVISFYFSAFFLASWLVFYLFARKKKKKVASVLLGFKNINKGIWWGVLGGSFICSHILLVLWFSGNLLPLSINIPKVYTYLMLEFSFSLVGMEILLRYLLFLRLTKKNNLGIIPASILSTLFSIGIFMLNVNLNRNLAFVFGTSFYTIIQNLLSCWIAYKTRSLLPSIIFGLIVSVFLSIIFIH